MSSSPTSRRNLLRLGTSSIVGALLARASWPRSAAAEALVRRARSCIVLFLNGGPSHIDTFDPKPGAKSAGSFKAIDTRTPGLKICEHLPHLASQSNRLAVIRSMTSREGNHARAQYLARTSYAPNATIVHPSIGSWASAKLGAASDLPAFVSIGGPSIGGGFLGAGAGPLVVPKANVPPQDITYFRNVDEARFDRRYAALDAMEARFFDRVRDPKIQSRRDVIGKAVRMMRSPRLAAFDLSQEPETARAAYGATDFGQGCLLARRLVEAGVAFVEVVLDGWDTHQDNFTRTRDLMHTLDPALSALLDDLDARGLLASTLVACFGEFGRTPKINAKDGRDHHPQAFFALLAGAGIRGGIVHGATDSEGAAVVSDPVAVPDLIATMASRLGLDPSESVMTPAGRPIAITDGGRPIAALID